MPEAEPADVRTLLERRLGRPVDDFEWVGAGAWSKCFGFVDEGREWVVRLGEHVEDFERDRRAAAFSGPALPIPEVREIGRAFDGWYAISARVRGEPLEGLSAPGWRAVLPSLFSALDAMRRVEPPESSGFGDWNADGIAPHASWRDALLEVELDPPGHRIHGWRRRLAASPVGDRVFRAGFTRLTELAEAVPQERHLVHCDLINGNVLIAGDRISGIFDWGCALWGDFLYDLAWLEIWSPWHAGLAALDVRAEALRHFEATGVAVPDFDTRMLAYKLHIGLAHQAYNAHLGSLKDLAAVTDRVAALTEERP